MTEYEHALEAACTDPSLQNIARYDRASSVYVGLTTKRIENLWRTAAAGAAVTATAYFFTGFPNTAVAAVLLAWAAGVSVPITRTTAQKRRVLSAVDGWHVVFDRWNRRSPNDSL